MRVKYLSASNYFPPPPPAIFESIHCGTSGEDSVLCALELVGGWVGGSITAVGRVTSAGTAYECTVLRCGVTLEMAPRPNARSIMILPCQVGRRWYFTSRCTGFAVCEFPPQKSHSAAYCHRQCAPNPTTSPAVHLYTERPGSKHKTYVLGNSGKEFGQSRPTNSMVEEVDRRDRKKIILWGERNDRRQAIKMRDISKQ